MVFLHFGSFLCFWGYEQIQEIHTSCICSYFSFHFPPRRICRDNKAQQSQVGLLWRLVGTKHMAITLTLILKMPPEKRCVFSCLLRGGLGESQPPSLLPNLRAGFSLVLLTDQERGVWARIRAGSPGGAAVWCGQVMDVSGVKGERLHRHTRALSGLVTRRQNKVNGSFLLKEEKQTWS